MDTVIRVARPQTLMDFDKWISEVLLPRITKPLEYIPPPPTHTWIGALDIAMSMRRQIGKSTAVIASYASSLEKYVAELIPQGEVRQRREAKHGCGHGKWVYNPDNIDAIKAIVLDYYQLCFIVNSESDCDCRKI